MLLKVGVLSLLGVVIFLVLSITVQMYISKSTDLLDQKFRAISSEIDSKKWSKVNKDLKKAKKKWTHIKPIWSLFLHHQEIDAIDEALIKTERAAKTESYVESQIEMGTLLQYIGHIPERESLNLVNIL